MDKERIYSRLPIGLQNLLVRMEGARIQRTRYSPAWRAMLAGCEARDRLDGDALRAFRDARIAAFVAHAARTVPHYRDLFARTGLDPRDIRGLDDLPALPVLTKDEIRDDPARFRSEAFDPRGLLTMHTSGSTGAGLVFPVTHQAIHEQYAIWWRYRRWHGIEPGAQCLYFGGRSIVPLRQKRPPWWRHNRPGNEWLFSGYHLGPATADAYLDAMAATGATWIHGYPSMVSLIASLAVDRGRILPMTHVTLGAESVMAPQAEVIRKAFGVEPLQHYGMTEAAANISQCPHGRLHVDEDYAAVELLPAADGLHEIVGTNLANLAFPLIRYRIGDLADLAESETCCPCGRPGRTVRRIDGRREDYVITRSGARIGRLDHIFKDMVNVAAAQIVQDRPGRVTLRIVAGARFAPPDELRLRAEADKRFGREVQYDIEYVRQIPRTRRGKIRLVVSQLPEGGLLAPVAGAA